MEVQVPISAMQQSDRSCKRWWPLLEMSEKQSNWVFFVLFFVISWDRELSRKFEDYQETSFVLTALEKVLFNLTNWRQYFYTSVLLLIMNFVITLSKWRLVDPQTALTMLWRNLLSITGQTHWKLTSICFLRWQIVELRALARWRVPWISNSCEFLQLS